MGLVDPSGSLAEVYRYDGYGQDLADTGQAARDAGARNPFRFRGALNLGTGTGPLYEMGARLYAPSMAAWTQLDTYAGTAQDPASMNRFLYAQGNPTTFIDPTGHKAEPPCLQGPACPSPEAQKAAYEQARRARAAAKGPRDKDDPRDPDPTDPPLLVAPAAVDPFAVSASSWFQGESRRLFDECNAIGNASRACDELAELMRWQSQNEAMFCAANPAVCQAYAELRQAQLALGIETVGTVAIVAGAWLDPIPGDEVVVTGAALGSGGGVGAATASRIQQLKDRISALLARGGARVAAPASETTGGLTNLGRTGTGVTLDGFQPGQAFSGVFDEATGTFLAVPSTRPPLPANWVPRAGGHAFVNARLTQAIGTPAAGRAGFTAFLEADGTISVEWLSRSVNGLANPYVPEAMRPDILRAIGLATGMATFLR